MGNKETAWTELPNADKITKIKSSAFEGCTNLALTSLPKNIKEIGYYVFYGCENITLSKLPEQCSLINMMFFNCKKIQTMEVLNPSVKESHWTFKDCINLKEITIGKVGSPVIETMPTNYLTFAGCTQNDLTIKIYLPSGQTSLVGESWGARNATIEYYDATTGELVNVIWGCKYKGNTDITWTELPNADKITKIKEDAFEGCTNLALTSLPKNLIEIGCGAFYNCENIVVDKLPENCPLINTVFFGCKKIEKMDVLNPSVKNAHWTFAKCTGLKEITIGRVGNPVTETMPTGFLTFQDCTQNDLVIKIYLPNGQTTLVGQPWGARNTTIEYYDATTGEKIN